MAKAHRGKGIRNLPARGRGTCPICHATRVKVLYDRTAPDGKTVKVCKRCRRKDFAVEAPLRTGAPVRSGEPLQAGVKPARPALVAVD